MMISINTNFSKSLCFPLTRKHFCVSATRGNFIGAFPKNKSLKGAIPLLLNIKVGSFLTTIGADGTISCPFDLKKSKNVCLTLRDSITVICALCFLSIFFLSPLSILIFAKILPKIRMLFK